jgi:stress response protein YsnF
MTSNNQGAQPKVEADIEIAENGENSQIVGHETVLKLAEEDVSIFKKAEDIGGVQVSRITKTYTKPVEEMLRTEKVEVERVPIDQEVTNVPEVRTEGDVTIVPVVVEELQLVRKLVLKEEVRIRRVTETAKFEDEVTLHRQEAVVTRLAPEAD